jgi:hypothetical protein
VFAVGQEKCFTIADCSPEVAPGHETLVSFIDCCPAGYIGEIIRAPDRVWCRLDTRPDARLQLSRRFHRARHVRNMHHFSDKLSQLASNPGAVTAFDGAPALCWLFDAITVIVRNREIPNSVGKKR